MSRFLRFCAFLSVLFLTTNVFAAGYTCPTAKKYTSCATNYYVSDCGTTFSGQTLTTDDLTAGNSCIACPDGYTCSGGLVCPRISQVTIAYVTGNTTLGQSQPFAGVATSLATISRMSTNVPAALKNTNYGWTFAGWATAPNTNEVTYTDGQSVTLTENTVLYGVWERTITVNYYASATARTVTSVGMSQYYRNTSTTVAGVSAVARPALVASNYGWTPIGWSYGTTTTPQITTITNTAVTIPVGVPAALNAVYTRSAAVTYNGNGNTGGSTNATGYTQLFNAANGAADSVNVTLASNGFTKTGHTFSKWAAGSTGGTQYPEGATFTPTNTAWTSTSSYTMYAIWAAVQNTISFDANGGSGGQSADVTATYGTKMPAISATAPTRTGYTFMGWYDSATYTSGTQYYDAAGASVGTWNKTADTTLYAGWKANTYTVSFNANSGSGGQSANVTATYDNAMPSISTTAPTRTGYTFMGWYDNATYTSGTQYYTAAGASARTWDKTANTTLYAGWKANDIYVRLDKNGGSGMCAGMEDEYIATLACTYNSDCVLPAWDSTTCNIVNVATGSAHLIFTGWNTAEDGSGTTYAPGANVKNIISSGMVMLYAVWTNPTGNIVNGQAAFVTPVGNAPTAIVTCNTGYQTSGTYSGTAGNPNFSYTCTAISYTCAAGKYLPKSSTSCASCPAGYYCAGGTYSYNTSSDQGITGVCASGYSTGGASASTCTACTSGYAASGTAYTAHDQKSDCKRTITLNKNGGSGTIQGTSGTTNASVVCSEGVACSFGDASVLTQDGYTFKTGWGTSASCTATTNSFTTPTSSTYYACKSANTFTVSYAGNSNTGGSAPTSPTSCTYDSACTAPSNTYTKTGFRFTGWKCTGGTTACDGDIIAAGGSLKNVSTGTGITLTAQWTPNVYTVYFKTGNTNMGSQAFSYGVSQKLTAVSTMSNIPVSSDYGWTFAGWATEPNTNEVTYTNGQSVSNLTTTHGGTVVLYGVWQRDVDLLYYSSATAVQPTMTSGVQSYYNSSTTAATRTAITLPLLSTSTVYSWAPYGWALNSNTTTTATVSATTATTVTPAIDVGTTDGLVYTALYKRTASVSYSGNGATGGSTSSTSGTQYFNTGNGAANALTLTLASNGFTKTGYTFSKWAAGNAGASYTFPNTAWASDASVSTNATWTANQYTVTLDAGDIASGTVYTTYNTAVYTDSARTKAMSTSANAVTLLPTKSVTVTYNANGGSVSSTSARAYMPFNGYWSATSGGTQYIGTGGYITDAGLIAAKGYTANKTWYAQWSPTTVSLPTPTRTGYTFAGWATSSSATSGVTGNYSVTGDVTLYATWSANLTGAIDLLTKTFSSTSDTTGMYLTTVAMPTPVYIRYNTGVYTSTAVGATAITKLTTVPTLTGYTFEGFYTGKAGTGTQVIDASGNFTSAVKTLYPTAGQVAEWYPHFTANCNQVLLNANGGTAGSVTKLYKKSGSGTWYTDAACTTSDAVSTNVKPTRSGYTFRGFYTEDLTDVSVDVAESTDIRMIGSLGGPTTVGNSWKITGTETLYAAWAKNCDAGTKATCSLDVADGVDYITGCDAGWHITSGVNTYAPVCMANTYYIQYDADAGAAMGTPSWARFKTHTYTYDTESYLEEAGGLWSESMDYTYAGKRYAFVGWSRTQGATTPDSDLESPSDTGTYKAWNLTTTNGATVYLYAVWSECNTCLVETGATCDLVDAVTCTYETSCLPGYKEASGAGTYRPLCDPIDYQIKYNANCDGATGTMANTVLDYNDKVNLTTNGFTCGTKKFLGWADVSGCEVTLDGDRTCDVVYTQGQEVEKLTTADGSVVHLFAVWGGCPACSAGTGASCFPSAPQGVCTYTTSCLDGYNTLVGDGTNKPSCSANSYTVKYNMNCPSGATCSSAPSNTACTYAKTCIFSDIQSTSLYAGGYKLTGWASTTTGTGEAAGMNLTTTNNGTVTRYAIWSKCAAGTYHPASTGTAANVCTNAADGKFVAAAGATADVACAQGSYSEKSSASTQCVACPAGRTTAGTGTNYNATANTACSATCSNNTGVYAWATPSWSNNTVANLCTVTSCSSTYYKNSNACALCSGLASGFYPNSDNGNSSGTSACFTNELSGQYVKSANDSAATDCTNWTYRPAHTVNYGSTSTCAPCAAVPSAVSGVAWTKASGTKWTSYNQCVVTQTPANCDSGTVKRTQISTTAWGDTTLVSTLKSEDGYYADTDATACTICPSGSYCPAGATTSTRCAVGSYSSTTGQHECVACQDGKTTSGTGQTSCNATCSNTAGVSDWETASWTTSNTITNLCTVAATAGCSENYYKSSNSCLTCSSGTNSKYTLSAAGTTSVNSCYLKTTAGKYVATKGAGETACISPYYCKGGTTVYYGTGTTTGGNSACTGLGSIYTKSDASASVETQCYATTSAGKYVTAKATAEAACPAGDWCEGSVKVYYGSAGGNTDCPDGYTDGTTGYSQQSQCLMNVAGGKYVATQNESSASGTCAKGYAKVAHTVNYGSTSSCTACTGATYAASTGQTSCTACPTATNDTANVSSYGYWNTSSEAGNHTVRAGCYALFKAKTLDDGAMTNYRCYVDSGADTYGVDGTSKTCWVLRTELTCDGGYYNATFNNSSTATQYTANKTLTNLYANACTNVGAGYWSADESLTRTACTSPLTTIGYGTGANEVADCGRKLHMGDNVVYLRSDKRTTPSLRVKVGDTTFYGALSTSLSSAMKVKNGSTEYSVVNDYQ